MVGLLRRRSAAVLVLLRGHLSAHGHAYRRRLDPWSSSCDFLARLCCIHEALLTPGARCGCSRYPRSSPRPPGPRAAHLDGGPATLRFVMVRTRSAVGSPCLAGTAVSALCESFGALTRPVLFPSLFKQPPVQARPSIPTGRRHPLPPAALRHEVGTFTLKLLNWRPCFRATGGYVQKKKKNCPATSCQWDALSTPSIIKPFFWLAVASSFFSGWALRRRFKLMRADAPRRRHPDAGRVHRGNRRRLIFARIFLGMHP